MLNLHDATQWVLLFAAAMFAGGWLILSARSGNWLKAHAGFLDAKQQAQIIEAEHTVYQAAADWLIRYIQATGDKVHPGMGNPIERFAVQLALDHPNTVAGDPAIVAARILAKIPPTMISTDTTAATVKTTTVTVESLPPIGDEK